MQQINKKKFLLNLVIILFLVTSNFLIGSYLREGTMNKIMWPTDDPIAISVARSYEENGNFQVHFLRGGDFNYFNGTGIDAIKLHLPIVSDYNAKGPLHSILLGDFYKLLGTTPKDLYFHASIFSNLLTSIFLVMFFIFIKKNFNLKIAFFSSFLILFNSYFGIASTKVMSDAGLLFIFSLLSLFFLEKKKTHYFLFGIFAGLSHLTHPFGIFMGSAYGIYLLIHREFKGFLITILGWQLVLLPWFVRNYYLYRDIGWGLWLPFSTKISYLISIATHTENQIVGSKAGLDTIISSLGSFEPFQSFIGLLIDEGNDIWFVSFLLIFIFSITAFAFLKIDKLRINKKFVLLGFVALSYILVYFSHSVYLQIIFSFIVPLILVYLLYLKNNSIFEKKLPRLYYFIIFYAFINLIFYYVSTIVVDRTIPELREIIFAVFMLAPVSLFSLDKFLQKIESRIQNKLYQEKSPLGNPSKFKYNLLKKNTILKIIPFLIMGLILSPMMIQMIEGLEFMGPFFKGLYPVETNSIRTANSWINSNIHAQKVASNYPAETYFRTTLDSIPLPPSYWNQTDQDLYLANYNISYLIFYGLNNYTESKPLYSSMQYRASPFLAYSQVYANGDSYVIKIKNNIESADMTQPDLYLAKAYLAELGGMTNTTKIYDEILNFEPTSITVDEKLCNGFLSYHKFDYAITKCGSLLKKDETNVIALSNLVIVYEQTGQKVNLLDTLEKYKNLIIKDPVNPLLLGQWINTMNTLNGYDVQYKKIIVQNLLDILEKYNTLIIKDPENQALIGPWTNLINTLNGYGEQYKKIIVQNLLDILEKYNTLIIKDPENQALIGPWTNLINTLNGYGEQYKKIIVQNLLDILEKYNTLIIKDPENQALIGPWTNLMNTLNGYDVGQYKKIVVDLSGEATKLEEKGDSQDALSIYKRIQGINGFGESSLESQIRVLTKLKQYDDAIKTYDALITILQSEKNTSKEKEVTYGKVTLLTNLQEYEKAADVYLEIERLDMFDKNAHEKRAMLLEKLDMPEDALNEYKFLNHLEPTNQDFIQKISSLTAKIKNG